MIDAFFNTPLGMAVYSVLVFVGIVGAVWMFGYGAAKVIDRLIRKSN